MKFIDFWKIKRNVILKTYYNKITNKMKHTNAKATTTPITLLDKSDGIISPAPEN